MAALPAAPASTGVATRGGPLRVATGHAVLADLVRQIGGDRVHVASLLPAQRDPHGFQPGPEQARELAGADVVVLNGLGFEGWFDGLVRESGYRGRVIVASHGIAPLPLPHGAHRLAGGATAGGAASGTGHAPAHADAAPDPHAWLDLAQGVRYAENIRDGLTAADPAGAADYRAYAEACIAHLRVLDAWTKRQVASLPPSARVLVANHDALGYFARAYGFSVRAPATGLDDAAPSAQDLAAVIAFVRNAGVPAIFLEHGKQPGQIEQIAREAGVRIGGTLYLDVLPPETGGVPSYAGMFLHNVRTIVRALTP